MASSCRGVKNLSLYYTCSIRLSILFLLLPIVLQHIPPNFSSISSGAVLGFLYVSIFSMFLGFFAWYRGLSLGGVARVGQVQLLQPFLTILASTIIFGEHLSMTTLAFAPGVIVCVALGRRTQIGSVANLLK